MKPLSGYLPTLDGWRAVAITGVLLCHGTEAVFCSDGPHPSPVLYGLTRIGAKGVDLFFAISGFLITSRLLEEYRKVGHISLRKFYVRRAYRILPPYFVYLAAIGLGVWAGAWAVSPVDLATCLTFTRNYLAPFDAGSWYTGHFWSLCVEEHFYLLWPGLIALAGPRRALWWAATLAAMLMVWATVEFRLQLLPRLLPGVGYYPRTDICLGKLLTGAALAAAVDRYPRWIRGVIRPWSVWPAALALGVVLTVNPPLAMHAEAALFALLVTATVLWPETPVGRALELSAVRWVGRVSYSLYLWQQMFAVPCGEAGRIVQQFPWNLAASVAVAAASYYAVERPLIRFAQRMAPSASVGRQ